MSKFTGYALHLHCKPPVTLVGKELVKMVILHGAKKHGDIRAVNHQPTTNKFNQEKHNILAVVYTLISTDAQHWAAVHAGRSNTHMHSLQNPIIKEINSLEL